MEVTTSVDVTEPTDVASARRAATACARGMGFAEADVGRVALAATEAATNLVKHAGGGTLLVGAANGTGEGANAVDLVAVDRGPGMVDVDACLVDGYSTAGSPGTGLGALQRISTLFDCYSRPGRGTVVLSRIAPGQTADQPRQHFVEGGVSIPYPGELVCGDDWAVRFDHTAMTVVVCDGLGHGPSAAEAARAATTVLAGNGDRGPSELVALMHDALRHTRGGAAAVARIDAEAARVRYCGVGNISGTIVDGSRVRHLVSHNGTLGHEARRIHEFVYDWPQDALLVLHSDGIATRWRLHEYAGLAARHPSVIAGVLYRDFRRGRDDATAVVVKRAANGDRSHGSDTLD
jgi:anti-sigma regulatory factor (Ser/Thr protein kinase)